jgi:5-(aminomethyl)-3-furanmethanol phosphate kinase
MGTINTYQVVKLGGSLMRSPHLGGWLDACVREGQGRVVIVPGGGEYADRVRRAQHDTGLSDLSAHRLALLAMVQYGHLLMSLQPGLLPVSTLTGIHETLQAERIPVWLPLSLLNDEGEVPASWDWSSDSIALWFTHQLEADLCLVKSVAPSGDDYTAEQLQQAGIVDRAFPQMLGQVSEKVWWLGGTQYDLFRRRLAAGHRYGAQIVLAGTGTEKNQFLEIPVS